MKVLVKATLVSIATMVVLVVSEPHAADLPIMPPPKAIQDTPAPVRQQTGFESLGADCIEASDGCRSYTRAGDGLFDAANNLGITCQPKPLSCTKRK